MASLTTAESTSMAGLQNRVVQLHPHRMVIGPDGVEPFVWPAPLAAVERARDHFARACIRYVRGEGVDKSATAEALWLALPHLAADFCYVFQAFMAGHRLAELGWAAEFGEAAAVAGAQTVGLTRRIEYALRLPGHRPWWRRMGRLGKAVLQTGPVVMRPPFAIDRQRDVVTFQMLPGLLRQARAERHGRVVISRFDDWFAPADSRDDNRQPGLTAGSSDAYREIVAAAFAAGEARLDDMAAAIMLEAAQRLVQRIQSMQRQLERKRRHLPLQFWCGTGGNMMNRIFARAIFREGGKSTGFDHGMSTGLWDSWVQTLLEFNWFDRFVTFSETMAVGLHRNCSPEFMARPDHVCQIQVASDSKLPEMAATSEEAGGRQVVYVPTVYAGRSTELLPLLPDIVAVDWQARLFSFLRGKGWQIVFKPHPESFCTPPDAFSQFGVEVIDRPFEALAGGGATMIFDYPQSTAFRSALMSQRPIVFINLPRLPLQQGVRELLSRRCAIVDGWFDAVNRVQVDWENLAAALNAAPKLAVDVSVRDALFPLAPAGPAASMAEG